MRAVMFLLAALPLVAQPFAFRERSADTLELTDRGAVVFAYNHGMILQEGAPANLRRSGYLHPVHAPNGAIVTDDFPKDHYHHRGISWMWPVVMIDGVRHDLWVLRGIRARFVRWTERVATGRNATLGVENGWFTGEMQVVREHVTIRVHPVAGNRRDMDFTLRFESLGKAMGLSGSPDQNKGYGGFNIRFGPRENTVIRTAPGEQASDSDLKPQPWAELAGTFGSQRAGVRITVDSANPGFPNGWCLRHYGFLGVSFPGLGTHTLEPSRPLELRYRVTLFSE